MTHIAALILAAAICGRGIHREQTECRVESGSDMPPISVILAMVDALKRVIAPGGPFIPRYGYMI